MTAPLAFPGGRTLAGWWRQLAPWKPQAWWVGHLLLHRVEALVRVARSARPDALHALLLQAIALGPDEPLDRLDQRLHLGIQLLARVARSLTDAGLLAVAEGGRLVPTPTGRDVLSRGEYRTAVHERRVFYFVEPGLPDQVPHFLPLKDPPSVFLPAAPEWRFDPTWLSEAVARPVEWKRRFGFPAEVEEVVLGPDEFRPGETWRRVVLDRPERLPLAAVLAAKPEGGQRLLGFAVRQDSWQLQSEEPLVSLEEGWQEAFPTLARGPSAADWEETWRSWCQPRGFPSEAASLQPEAHRLRVTVSARLLERLRATRSDALRGEAWLLAGPGSLRAAAQIDIVESEARPAQRASG